MDDGITRHDIIIDERTGQLIGEREVITYDGVDLPNGTVLSYTLVTTNVVDHIGSRRPAGILGPRRTLRRPAETNRDRDGA
jgi:hypothetical protein